VTDGPSAENAFKLLPLSLLALRVSKSDPHEGHGHAPSKPAKRVKGLWTVKIEQQQEIGEQLHFIWLYEGPQWKTKLYAGGALVLILAVVLFPLWPASLRLGVWYLSMGMLGLIGLFFAMSIFRLILFGITMFAAPPGLWLYPNLFEDVGFFDSFRPVWGWQEEKKKSKKRKSQMESAGGDSKASSSAVELPAATASKGAIKPMGPRVEEVEDSD
jgi:translocation protein SEC62